MEEEGQWMMDDGRWRYENSAVLLERFNNRNGECRLVGGENEYRLMMIDIEVVILFDLLLMIYETTLFLTESEPNISLITVDSINILYCSGTVSLQSY